MAVVVFIAGVPLALGIAMYLYGRSLPENHRERISVILNSPREKIWGTITDYNGMPSWWSDVKSVSQETRSDGTLVTWNTDAHNQRIGFITIEEQINQKLVRKILDQGLAFGGTWTFELTDMNPGQTKLVLTEDGFVHPPFFRAFLKLFLGNRTTMDSFIRALQEKLKPG